jgi:DNA-3-methyladenine glycosylase II
MKHKKGILLNTDESFTAKNFLQHCRLLAQRDTALATILKQYGPPPMWQRTASFETLIHIILEQQVSLASAKAALEKLKEKVGQVTPQNILLLTDADLKACYFSRQKTLYARHLAQAILCNQLNIELLQNMPNDDVRTELKKIKGIGDWTVDVYLMMVLQRADLFPLGDIALVNSMKAVKQLDKHTSKTELLQLAENWRPYRTVAAYILWHAYLCKRSKQYTAAPVKK